MEQAALFPLGAPLACVRCGGDATGYAATFATCDACRHDVAIELQRKAAAESQLRRFVRIFNTAFAGFKPSPKARKRGSK